MCRPGDLDNRIAKEIGNPQSLQWNVRESYASIARRIGVDEETVRKRIKRAEKAGSVVRWRVFVAPNLIGCVDVYADLEVGDSKEKADVVSQLKHVDGVINILDFEGRGLFILFDSAPGDPLARKLERIGGICGVEEFTTWNGVVPACDLKLSQTDWRIVWTIRNEPRKNLSQVAREAGVTVRTVNRRLSLLTEHRAIFLLGRPDFGRAPGVSANFLVHVTDPAAKASVADKIGSRFQTVVFGAPIAPRLLFYNIVFENLTQTNRAADWIRGLEGVQGARLAIMKELTLVTDWIDGQIRKRAFAVKERDQASEQSMDSSFR
jgi:DNA-binding Lrp family transcriptional regulator